MNDGSRVQLANNSALTVDSFPANGIDCVTVYNGTTQSAMWYNTFKEPIKLSSSPADAVRQEYPPVDRSRLYITFLQPQFQGLYRCEVADIDGETQELFLGMYTSAIGISVLLAISHYDFIHFIDVTQVLLTFQTSHFSSCPVILNLCFR